MILFCFMKSDLNFNNLKMQVDNCATTALIKKITITIEPSCHLRRWVSPRIQSNGMKTVKLRFATSATTTSPCTCGDDDDHGDDGDHDDDHHVEDDDVDVDDNDHEGHTNFSVHMYMYM